MAGDAKPLTSRPDNTSYLALRCPGHTACTLVRVVLADNDLSRAGLGIEDSYLYHRKGLRDYLAGSKRRVLAFEGSLFLAIDAQPIAFLCWARLSLGLLGLGLIRGSSRRWPSKHSGLQGVRVRGVDAGGT